MAELLVVCFPHAQRAGTLGVVVAKQRRNVGDYRKALIAQTTGRAIAYDE
jgi:hypothetical protein